MRRFVITGAPGSGKTAIIRQLELEGFSVVEEAATDVIAAAHANGKTQPWTDPAFIDAVAKLQQAGFSEQVKSWLGNGQNLPISADQLRQVLGNDTVRQLAARYNIPVDQISQVLAQELPKAVDHASPDGRLPHTA